MTLAITDSTTIAAAEQLARELGCSPEEAVARALVLAGAMRFFAHHFHGLPEPA